MGEPSPHCRAGPAAVGGASPAAVLGAETSAAAWAWAGPGASALALLCFFPVPPPHEPGQALLCKSLFFIY